MTAALAPLCVDSSGFAVLLQVSERHLRRLDDSGAIPAALSFGTSKRWFIEEIQAWLRAGAPSRSEWSNLRSGLGADREREAGVAHRR